MTDRPRKPSQVAKLPRLSHNVIRPTGPRVLNVREVYVGGYGAPPAGFVVGQTSVTEWIAYWALAKIYDDPKDPRKPPFFGGLDWSYQVPKGGKWTRAVGSAVLDFFIYQGMRAIGIRIQTEYFHIFTDNRKHANDLMQKVNLSGDDLVIIDVYDNQLLGDPSGQKAIIAMKEAIGLIEQVSPITGGNALRGSKLKVLNG